MGVVAMEWMGMLRKGRLAHMQLGEILSLTGKAMYLRNANECPHLPVTYTISIQHDAS